MQNQSKFNFRVRTVASRWVALSLLCAATAAFADTNSAPAGVPKASAPRVSPVTSELRGIMMKIQRKAQGHDVKEADLADELKALDGLIANHKDEKTDEMAQVMTTKAMIYFRILDDEQKGTEIMKQVQHDYPETRIGRNAEKTLASLKSMAEAKKIQSALAVGTKFPDFQETDVAGKPLSVSAYKGKVVLIDFWATWCGPCVGELPNVLKTYQKHHGEGFEIIGISLDQDKGKLMSFTSEKNMTWAQFFDGKGWENKLADKYGVKSIPATYLLDREGKILAQNLRGEALEAAVAKALATK